MSNLEKIQQNITKGIVTYIYEEFEEAVIKILPDETVFIKRKGNREQKINSNSKTVFDIELGGDFVTEEFYENY